MRSLGGTLALRRCILMAALIASTLSPAFARTARVPEDFSTIQAAVDHLAPLYVMATDTVLVQAGHYPERVVIREMVRLEGVPAPGCSEPLPRIDGLTIQPPPGGKSIQVIGIHVTGPARTASSDGPARIFFVSCRFDAGMEGPSWFPKGASMSMRRCTLFGRVTLCARETIVDSCAVYGPLDVQAVSSAIVTNNRFENVPGVAARVSGPQRLRVAQNVVLGGGSGFEIFAGDGGYLHVEDNRIEGCAGTGIWWHSWRSYRSFIERNHVSHCGGTGIWSRGIITARGNRVLDCGGHGLDLVEMDTTWPAVKTEIGLVEGNVVGRCGGDGIRLQKDYEFPPKGFDAKNNTVFECAGSGILAFGLTVGKVSNNVAYRNRGYGLVSAGSEAVPVSCNDWFENKAGATSGVQASTGDLAVDPLFCDVAAADVQLRSDSPLLDASGCGFIGALGQGCEPPPVTIGLEVWPRVLTPAPHGADVTAWLEPGPPFAEGDIEVATVRLNDVPVLSTEGVVGDHDRDGVPDLQLQFDRNALRRVLPGGRSVTVTITGRMRGRLFIGTDEIRVPPGNGASQPEAPRWGSGDRVLQIHAPVSTSPGDRFRIAFTLADESPARLEVLDVAGRVIDSRDVQVSGPAEHELDLGTNGRLAQGIYFLRLRQGVSEARTRVVVVR